MVLKFGFHLPRAYLSWDREIESILSHGFQWIEVEAPIQSNRQLVSLTKKIRDRYGFRLAVHANYLGLNLSSCHPLVRKASVRAVIKDLNFAQFVGAYFLILHGGDTGWYDILPPSHAEFSAAQKTHQTIRSWAITSLGTSLKELVKYKEMHDFSVELLIENLYCPWELLNSPQEIREVITFVDSSTIGVCLDFGHAQISGFGISEYHKTLGKDIRVLHLHENDLQFDIHLPINTIRSTWVKTLSELHKLRKVIPAIIELPDQSWDKVLSSYQALEAFTNTLL